MGLWDYENFFYVGRIVPSSHRPIVSPFHRPTIDRSPPEALGTIYIIKNIAQTEVHAIL